MSHATDILENLVKFVEINMERLKNGESTICKTDKGITVRDNLPCANKDDSGEYIIKCEDCPFHTLESHQAVIDELNNEVIKKQKVMDMLMGEKS